MQGLVTLFSEEIRWSSKQAALDLSLLCTLVMVLSFSLTLVPAHHQLARIGVLEVRGFVFHRDLPSMFGQVLTRGARPRSRNLLSHAVLPRNWRAQIFQELQVQTT